MDVYASEYIYQERINLYLSDIVINDDGSINVIETITVTTNNTTIKHGIYRDYPLMYNKGPIRYEVDFEIKSIEIKDNQVENASFENENYWTERIGTGIRIYVGNKTQFLSPGSYTYKLTYTVSDQIRTFKDYQEFYYNITGNEWDFPIDNACTIIRWSVPYKYENLETNVYTGVKGSKESNATIGKPDSLKNNGQAIKVCTTKPLNKGEGLTVSTAFKNYKGETNEKVVFNNLPQKTVLEILLFNLQPVAIIISTFFIILVSIFITLNFSKDVDRKATITEFLPNTNISTAATRYIATYKMDQVSFSSMVISLAIKGWILIKEEEHKGFKIKFLSSNKTKHTYFILERKLGVEEPLDEEKMLYLLLFATNPNSVYRDYGGQIENNKDFISLINKVDGLLDSFSLKAYDSRMQAAWNRLYILKSINYKQKYTKSKSGLVIIPALILTLLGVILPSIITMLMKQTHVYYLDNMLTDLFILGIFFVFSIGSLSPIYKYLENIKKNKKVFSNIIGICFALFLFAVINLPFIFIGHIIEGLPINTQFILFANIFITPITLFMWYKLIRRTPKGEELYRNIRGFEKYITIAEKERIRFFNKKLPEDYKTFEKYLPYAIALDLDSKWTDMFEDSIKKAIEQQGETNALSWYTGVNIATFSTNFSSFNSSFSSSLSSSISSSSSGSGGGGSSGGGGGGGGGGGW